MASGLITHDMQRALTAGDRELFIVHSLDTIFGATAVMIERIADVDEFVETGRGILSEPKGDVLVGRERRLLTIALRLSSCCNWCEGLRSLADCV
ncbi:hypothetical protein [Bradyrhizobium canariense]|uniref:hypothetical protein n=1 Tax=Bradyrhizobium canariense TaxID=255045 RepID=UPI000A239717|nr:hypothetical protein [Bradyrhizobium canariense]OSI80348.1 hypothetical protein BSZ22_01010 [Bradyrhizobium canariense]OSI82509.1 hypothetical protein BSZ23_01215 [Bradyrhizobium canariense]